MKTRNLNRALLWALPVVFLLAGADIAAWNTRWSQPLPPLPPSLKDLSEPPPEVPGAGFTAGLFEQPAPRVVAPPPKAEPEGMQVAPEIRWKLSGVVMAGGKRAFLMDESGKGVWVTEGERAGTARVKEIRDRSVVMEGEEGEYEIRM